MPHCLTITLHTISQVTLKTSTIKVAECVATVSVNVTVMYSILAFVFVCKSIRADVNNELVLFIQRQSYLFAFLKKYSYKIRSTKNYSVPSLSHHLQNVVNYLSEFRSDYYHFLISFNGTPFPEHF